MTVAASNITHREQGNFMILLEKEKCTKQDSIQWDSTSTVISPEESTYPVIS
jgi:hypothetical protein